MYAVSFVRYEKQGYKDRIIFVLSLFLGAVTHIVCDAFTHDNGFFCRDNSSTCLILIEREILCLRSINTLNIW
ncbi:DUF4184 family protein [Photorhabdus laumondii subsp. laumondii]|uniref:DUF4184 family protein n=1 Tax=Photorhabdus laumondii subsp. laumondii TaxID=141679 RepID=A0A6L9JW28_PHOLM|nr:MULTISPECIES: DUF4184 family protein [Photorhabdus]AXG47353.1 DUF4184 domain-containing protein [Photorhabdus laumondii subsp. laumondii]MCC8386240.1 DUF4184 family protein [Photorhabdus laumondii]MCC8414072.1 DUF4184 family protein [Photorhabdus laumondii]NDK96637.1 DUF4184 family protein [Photorhabdus laumondii subsp. laumondii]NDL22839.1 DUF4184 family protein [Photorhabdus laumondii subsp. laumondii]